MKWLPGLSGDSRDYYRDSDCGRWRLHKLDDGTRYALLDKSNWTTICVGTQEACKAEAENRGRQAA